jgi:hypothetical protein
MLDILLYYYYFIFELTNYVSVKLSMYNFVEVSLLYVKYKLI